MSLASRSRTSVRHRRGPGEHAFPERLSWSSWAGRRSGSKTGEVRGCALASRVIWEQAIVAQEL